MPHGITTALSSRYVCAICSTARNMRRVAMKIREWLWKFVSVESPQYRVAVTFLSNLAKSGLGFLTALMIARDFGPAKYGEYSFILATFSALAYLIDVGGANAFYSHISRRPRGKMFYVIYAVWMAAQFTLTSLILVVLTPSNLLQSLLMSDERLTLFMAFCAVFGQQQCINALTMILESDRKTVKSQAILLVGSIYYLMVMGIYSFLANLSMKGAFAVMLSQQLLTGFLLCKVGWPILSRSADIAEGWRQCWGDYVTYCRPLIPSAIFAFVYNYSDRWLLQRFAGSVEQGYFQVSMQLSLVTLAFATSILRVFAKEVAAAMGGGDRERLGKIYRHAYVLTITIVSFIAGMIAPWVDEILQVALGKQYVGAADIFIMLLIYPIYQSLGQIAGTFLMSVGQTALHSTISIVVIVFSLPLGFVLLAPSNLHGFDMGAFGLALKLFVVSFLSVNVLNFAVARRNGFKLDIVSQAAIPLFLGVGFMSKYLVNHWIGLTVHFPDFMFINAVLATLLYMLSAYIIYIIARSTSVAPFLLTKVLCK